MGRYLRATFGASLSVQISGGRVDEPFVEMLSLLLEVVASIVVVEMLDGGIVVPGASDAMVAMGLFISNQ